MSGGCYSVDRILLDDGEDRRRIYVVPDPTLRVSGASGLETQPAFGGSVH
jgi:hypothetical protein